MKILVCVASRHGATYEIGRAISDELSCVLARQRALATVDLVHVQQVTGLDEYDAVVIGSAVYMDHWIRAAHEFTTTRQRELASKQVWLFSSGPIGEPPRPAARTRDVDELMMLTGARQHQVFGGRLDKQLLTFGDGPVEMRETRKRGGVAVGVCSDEVRRFGFNRAKRRRLIRGGAHLLVPDYSDLPSLLRVLGIGR